MLRVVMWQHAATSPRYKHNNWHYCP